ncbi:hypothetical protein T484DRAFT_1843452 [Baffinella frigidus]|nr:hypothetical protein T484DRAFT_1843452 [Cryptophyta sp. CCMP2293]
MEEVARTLRDSLLPDHASSAPTTWSAHVCPVCITTVRNAMVLPGGPTCCWTCAADHCSNAIVYCPLSGRPTDVRALKLERVLTTFLRRFFPQALLSAPPSLLGNPVLPKPDTSQKSQVHGMLAAMRAAAEKIEEEPPPSTKRGIGRARLRRERSGAEPYNARDALASLDATVATLLVRLSVMEANVGGEDHGLQRRDRSWSEPKAPACLTLFISLDSASADALNGVRAQPASTPAYVSRPMWLSPNSNDTDAGGRLPGGADIVPPTPDAETEEAGAGPAPPGLRGRRHAAEDLSLLLKSQEG